MKYKENYNVLAHDSEPRGTMRNGAYLKYMQETANHQLRDEKPSYYELFDSGFAFILSRINIKIFKPLYRYDSFESLSWHCPSKGVMFQRCYELRKDNELFACANSVWALVCVEDGSIKKVGDFDTDKYTTDKALDTVQSLRFRIPKNVDMKFVGTKRVMYSEVDVNMHLNNRFYPDFICDFMENIDDLFVTEMSISFISEAPLGCELEVYRSNVQEDGCYYFRTMNGDKVNIEAMVRAVPYSSAKGKL